MINVTVINLKGAIKYLVVISIIVIGIICTRFFYNRGKEILTKGISSVSLTGCLDITLPDIQGKSNIKKIENDITSRNSTLRKMLNVELLMMDNLIIDGEEEDFIEANNNETEKLEEAKIDVETEQIEENNITPKYNNAFGTVKIKNESDKEITEEILTPNISLENNKDVIIFHTHTCESYTPSEQFNYEMTGSYRTTDLNYSVARVGVELKKYLNNYGYNVIHDQTYHDYPAYSGSYGRSLTTVKNLLDTTPNAQLVIDLHRDAIRKQCKLCTKCKNR